MKQVFVAQHPTEAHFVRGLLEADGIEAQVQGESLFGIRGDGPFTSDTLPSVWVLNECDAPRALELLAEFGREEGRGADRGGSWRCPGCAERVEFQFTECWHCGASRPSE